MKQGRQYAKGASAERLRVRWHLANGARWAARVAGSHGPFDVMAVYPEFVWIEQIKSGRMPTKEDREAFHRAKHELSRSAGFAGIRCSLMWRKRGGTWVEMLDGPMGKHEEEAR